MRCLRLTMLLLTLTTLLATAGEASGVGERAPGESLYREHCAFCHEGGALEAPGREALSLYEPTRIVASLTNGIMSVAGLSLSGRDMVAVAEFLTGRAVEAQTTSASYERCPVGDGAGHDGAPAASWTSWGGGPENLRYQGAEHRIGPASATALELAWTFAVPGATRMRSQPTVHEGVVYIGSQFGTVFALSADSGCVHWTFEAASEVRGAPAIVPGDEGALLLFGDFEGSVYAVDVADGTLRWRQSVHDHPLATITGSVVSDGVRAYVPVSSSEVVPAGQPTYPCCSFRGALVALDLQDGKPLWTFYTTDEPAERGSNRAGTPRFGPSGAPIWSTPTIDARRGLILMTTGQNYSSPATGTSDAIIAVDAATGARRWVTQVTAGDAWNGACVRQGANCPEENGPDFDLGASPLLITLDNGRDVVVAGQKSGLVYGLDPERDGAILWQRRVGSGGTMGGVHWGMASDGARLYVGVSDQPTRNPAAKGAPQPGVHTLDPATGEFIWRRVLDNRCEEGLPFLCWPGVSAAVSASPGLVYAGSMDGLLRVLSAESGETLWRYDTRRAFDDLSGAPARGGAIEADGPVIADGRLYVTSGYDKWGEFPGNVLLVFTLPAEPAASAAP